MITHKTLLQFLAYCYDKKESAVPVNWKVLFNSDTMDTDLHGFEASVFTNESTKQIIIAHHGTTFELSNFSKLYYDLHAWIDIYHQDIPNQFLNGGEYFLKYLQKKLSTEHFEDYKIINIGHSTGAINSDLSALYLKSHGIDTDSITYENPGAKPILEKYANLHKLNLSEQLHHFQVMNSTESATNALNEQFGQISSIDYAYHHETDSIFNKVSFVLHNIGEMLSIACKAYNSYIYLKHNLMDAHGGVVQDSINYLTGIHIINTISKGFIMAGVGITDLEQYITMHNFENFYHMINENENVDSLLYPMVEIVNSENIQY